MRYLYVFLLILFNSCDNDDTGGGNEKIFTEVAVKVIKNDSTISIRALEVNTKNDEGIFATQNGKIGIIKNYSGRDTLTTVSILHNIKEDTTVPHFRAIAYSSEDILALSVANPALLYKSTKDSLKLVYKEVNDKVFYDSMQFWNKKEGIAIGDPTDDCMSIIVTRNGGETWEKLPCSKLPKAKEGEAAFAASNTNIAIKGNLTWVATGGKTSRVLFSPDKGNTWTAIDVPIIQGEPATGIFSIAFYDELNGFAIGGDYTKPDGNTANKIKTNNGGVSWEVVADNKNPGYRSCVQYVPNSRAKQLVAIGFKGIDYSSDAGENWTHLSDESFYTLRFINDSTAYAAGKGRIAELFFK